jgi:CheY-like chemotaxis protein/two-component sensor histidine kinase
MLAHELRNPLAPIRNAVQLMERMPPTDPVQEVMRRMIERQSAHLTRIVDDMLDITRITRGTLSLEKTVVDLADVVARAVELATPAIEHGKHELSIDLPERPLLVNGDLSRLTQVLGNLLANAARFTQSGGRISVRVREEDDYAVLRVKDNGRGIPPDSLESIFGMFVQGKQPIHRVGGGLGVGLELARRITELHGGSVQAKSEGEDRGSELIVRLPRGPQIAPAAPVAQLLPLGDMAARRILVVDDNIDAAVSLAVLLRTLGHNTSIAHDGAMALKVAEEFRPDLVLLDIGLPGMNGYEVAGRLRQRFGESVRIVAVTGWGQEADRARSQEAGFDVHLVKPVEEDELRRILEAGSGSASVH